MQEYMLDSQDRRKKRCLSSSPLNGKQCEKRRKHRDAEVAPLHQAGSIVWADDNPGYAEVTTFPPGTKIEFDTTPLLGSEQLTGWQKRFMADAFQTGAPEFAENRFGTAIHEAAEQVSAAFMEPKPCDCPGCKFDGPLVAVDEAAGFAAAGPSPAELEIRAWWLDSAEAEMDMTIKKAIEYGSTDLIDIGLMLARTMKRDIGQEEAAELGIFFYLIGKIARWQSAIERGDRPSDDTLLDIGVYVRMAQRVRHSGGWPGVDPMATGPKPTPAEEVMHSMCDRPCGPNCPTPAVYPTNRSAG